MVRTCGTVISMVNTDMPPSSRLKTVSDREATPAGVVGSGAMVSSWLRLMLTHEHDLARHASLPQQLVRTPCLGKRKSLRDQRLDLLLLKEIEQGDQVLSEH